MLPDTKLFREFLQQPPRRELCSFRNITTSQFEGMAITDPSHRDLVSMHFQQHPVLYIDLKVNLLVLYGKGVYLMVQGCPWDHIRRYAGQVRHDSQ